MARCILDSCILIDVSRGNINAIEFLESLDEVPCISVLTITKILSGAHDHEKPSLKVLFSKLEKFVVDEEIANLGGEFVNQYRKSHNVSAIDALIAATAKLHETDIVTINRKHFPMFPGIKRPY